jgi:hypothetical protein
MWSIDGIQCNLNCDITRTVEIKASDISGMMLDRTMFTDVYGSYLRYQVKLAVAPDQLRDYYAVRSKLDEPVGEHTFVMPFDADMITMSAKVERIKDTWHKRNGLPPVWTGIEFEVIGTAPYRQNSLGQILDQGRSPLPEIAGVSVGDTYMWTGSEWQKVGAGG